MYTLQTDRLRVDISEPGVAPNTTTRFDRAGFIEEVVLDGIHRFCASEPRNLSHPCSGGRGICNEYITATADGAAVGERFMKPGVGLLLKETDEPYRFMNHYEVIPFQIDISHDKNAVFFVTQPMLCGGFALRQEKHIEVAGNRLEMRVTLENIGEREFVGNEYCHNFITVNAMTLGPDYLLEFPSGLDRGNVQLEGELCATGKGFTFSGPLESARMYDMDAGEFSIKPRETFEWIFMNIAEGAKVHVYEQINLSRVLLWAANHMFSTESFHKIKLAPGQSDAWTRTWVFDAI